MKWEPIETAPKDNGVYNSNKDGTDLFRILLRFGNETATIPPRDVVSVAYWEKYYAEGSQGYVDGSAWVEPCSGERLDVFFNTPPTHWMSIPILEEEEP